MEPKYTMTQEDALFYAKRNLVDSIWKEALIEGIDVTFPDTNEIIEGRAVAGISVDGIIIINNLKHGWQFITSAIDAEVDLNFVRQVNVLVGRNGAVNYPGELRLYEVKMGGTQWKPELPDYDQAKAAIAKIANESNALDRAFNMFAYICRAQLFSDGNKRTAQLVANKMLIRDGQGILAIPDTEKALFGNLLIDFYETGCNKALSTFLYEKCLDGHDSPSLVASDILKQVEDYRAGRLETYSLNEAKAHCGLADKELYEKFGVSKEEVEKRDVEYEGADWSPMEFGEVTTGRPKLCDEPMKTIES